MRVGCISTSFGPINQMVYHNHLSVLLHWAKEVDLVVYHLGDNQQETSLNTMTQAALMDNCDYLLYLEHDNIYPKSLLTDLLRSDVDCISGYYPFRNWPFLPIPLCKDADNGLIYRFEYNTGDATKPNLMEMSVACFGCCLVKAAVIKDLFSKGLVFRREYQKKSKTSQTVDIVFFKDLVDNGYKIHVDGNVRAGHLTQNFVVDPDNYQLFRVMVQLVAPGQVPSDERLTEEQRNAMIKALAAGVQKC